MKLDGFGIFTEDIDKMAEFYRDVLGFEIECEQGGSNVFLKKDGVLFLMYGRKSFEKMTNRSFNFANGINGHYEIALSANSYADVDKQFTRTVQLGVTPVMSPKTEEWGQRTCYIADPEGNLIEIGSFTKD